MIDYKVIKTAEEFLTKSFKELEDIALFNQEKVLNAFKKNQVALRHFSGTTGYGYGDEGRECLNKILADIFKAESAICSPTIASGTHALSLCLFGILRPGDRMLAITGEPYDTLTDVIKGENIGSLKDFGVLYDCIPLKNNKIDLDSVNNFISKNGTPKMIYMQR